ncbi:MAG: hypothetical protein MZV63_16680 [Marinilabiliales bacterium]|nr:hypothetical protein [Marinilabiliales bacterium]
MPTPPPVTERSSVTQPGIAPLFRYRKEGTPPRWSCTSPSPKYPVGAGHHR